MGTVNTVTGEVASGDLGITLMHEHVFINSMPEERTTGLLNDYALMRDEVRRFVDCGGRTIVDLTTAELTSGASPDPTGRYSGTKSSGYAEDGTREANNLYSLVRLSKDLGLNIVIGTGHYRDPYLDREWFDRVGTAGVADRMIRDLTKGVGESDVKAGIIGEIGADKWYVSAVEERAFRAAALAHAATGALISTHAARWPVGIDQLDILQSEGVDPRRVVIGHCDTVDIPEYHEEIARRGAFVQFDTIRGLSHHDTQRRIGLVRNLAEKRLLDHLLLSHDNCSRPHLRAAGGNGYDFVPTAFAEALRAAGLGEDDLQLILVENPRRALVGD